MNLDISGNLRRLRKIKDITQEELAEYLGVSFQAVSKWERGEGYPDITFILPIALYFGVSTDELLGMKTEKEELQVKEILERAESLIKNHSIITDENLHLFAESINIHAEGLKKFSNNFKLMMKYAMDLQYDHRINEPDFEKRHKRSFDENGNEIEHLCRRVLNECTNAELRYLASTLLIRVYAHRGEKDKALEICKTFPEYPKSRNIMATDVYDKSDENALPQYRKVFLELFRSLILNMQLSCGTNIGKQKLQEKIVGLCDAFFDDGEYGTFASKVIASCLNLSNDFNSNPERALAYMKKALEAAKHLDNIYNKTVKFGNNYIYKSFLPHGIELEPFNDFTFHQEKFTNVQDVIDTIQARKEKGDPRVIALIEEYKPYGGVKN
jgi:transcriptional regulator with XRE-family HTH domain